MSQNVIGKCFFLCLSCWVLWRLLGSAWAFLVARWSLPGLSGGVWSLQTIITIIMQYTKIMQYTNIVQMVKFSQSTGWLVVHRYGTQFQMCMQMWYLQMSKCVWSDLGLIKSCNHMMRTMTHIVKIKMAAKVKISVLQVYFTNISGI